MAVTIDGTSGINTPGVVNTAAETIATTLAVTGVTTFAAGTAALPAITTTGDTNTGIFFPAADTIAFAEGGAEAMRLTSAGNLCIGSTAAGDAGTINLSVGSAGVTSGGVQLWAGPSQEHYIQWGDSTTGPANYAGAISYAHASDAMKFFTVSTERARIDSSGTLLVGRTAAVSATTRLGLDATASIAGFVSETGPTTSVTHGKFINGNGVVGSISTSGSATAYNTSSDYRLKNTIAPMTGALAKVALLKPCTYKWKVDGSDGQGFIAHELDEVVPGCVTGEKDAVDADGNPQYQGIDTSFLIATLTAAIQELHALVKTQDSTITALTTRITALEAA